MSERVFEIKGFKIVVKRGDITVERVDAVVNPANSLMIMGGGVAGAIARKGGREIEEEARRHAPVPIGKAVATGAGRLPARYVIHAPTMERPAERTTVDNVRKAARAAINEALRLGVKSVAFPALGAGVGGVPVRESVRAILKEVSENARPPLEEIRLIAWSQRDYEAFIEAVEEFISGQ